MKTLLSKILIAQVITVVLALLVMTVITRVSLNRGFLDFLEKQESAVLQNLSTGLGELYENRGGWTMLRNNPRLWNRILQRTRPGQGNWPDGRPGGMQNGRMAPPETPEGQMMRWMRSLDRLQLKGRLFLLDGDKSRIAGAPVDSLEGLSLAPIESGGEVVGWIGFSARGTALPPDARRFLQGQIKITLVSLVIALVLAAALAFLLARHVSRPVRKLDEAVTELTRGDYLARASVLTRDEIGRLAENVNRLAQTLEKNRSARQRWMADIAHELRTPVAIMKGEIEAVADGVRQADEHTAASLLEEINQLGSLVEDMQTLALSDAGALNIRKEPVDLSALAGQAAETYRHRLHEKNVALEIHCGEEVLLNGDPQRVRQLFNNLLENSCRYVQAAGRVRLTLTEKAAEVEVVLEDSGPGVSDDQLERIFDRFYRAEGSRSRATGGTGLGLSICRNIAEAHGGSIRAGHSSLGGLEISINLPR